MSKCQICGDAVPDEAELHFHRGWAAYRLPGEVGVLHRHNGYNWSKARRNHPTPTAKAASKQTSDPEIDELLNELGGDSAVDRLVIAQALSGSATALRELLARSVGTADSKAFEAFRKGDAACPSCLKWPVPQIDGDLETVERILKRHLERGDGKLTWSYENGVEPSDEVLLELGGFVARFWDGAYKIPEPGDSQNGTP